MPDAAYTRSYYLTVCGGHELWRASRGARLPRRLSRVLELAAIAPGERVLDVGAGRGELARAATALGARVLALDSSLDAVALSRETLGASRGASGPLLACATRLPVGDGSLDVVLMTDVVEHLTPAELAAALREARRALAPGGRLVVHTLPNLWYYRFGYPLYRLVMRARGTTLPRDPRARVPGMREMHVNEQSPRSLRAALAGAGLAARVWLEPADVGEHEPSAFVRGVERFLASTPPFRLVFCDDIFAVARRAG